RAPAGMGEGQARLRGDPRRRDRPAAAHRPRRPSGALTAARAGGTVGRVTGTDGGRAAGGGPGGVYGAGAPPVMFAPEAVEQRGGLIRRISWVVPEDAADEAERVWVPDQVGEAVDAITAEAGIAAPVVIGKSLGTLAAPLAAGRGLPAVWLTPL